MEKISKVLGIAVDRDRAMLDHDLAVVGKIKQIKDGGYAARGPCDVKRDYVLFEVENSFGMKTQKNILIHYNTIAIHHALEENERYLIFLNQGEKDYGTSWNPMLEYEPMEDSIDRLNEVYKLYTPTEKGMSELTYFYTTLPLKGLWTIIGIILVMCLTAWLAMKADESDRKKKGEKTMKKISKVFISSLLIIALFWGIHPKEVSALDCSIPMKQYNFFQMYAENRDVLAVGKVTKIRKSPLGGGWNEIHNVTFEVERSWKKELQSPMTFTIDAFEGSFFEENQRVLIPLYEREGKYSMWACYDYVVDPTEEEIQLTDETYPFFSPIPGESKMEKIAKELEKRGINEEKTEKEVKNKMESEVEEETTFTLSIELSWVVIGVILLLVVIGIILDRKRKKS